MGGRSRLALASSGTSLGGSRLCATMPGRSRELHVHVHKGEIVVTQVPQLVLKHRAQTTDADLMARAWEAANDKARELGWIV